MDCVIICSSRPTTLVLTTAPDLLLLALGYAICLIYCVLYSILCNILCMLYSILCTVYSTV